MKYVQTGPGSRGVAAHFLILGALICGSLCMSCALPQSYGATSLGAQSSVAAQTEEVEKLKGAEYQNYLNAMRFEDDNQKLGNYYLHKGAEVHHLTDEIEAGQPVTKEQTDKALDTSNAQNYDNRPPVPLDDEIGNGY